MGSGTADPEANRLLASLPVKERRRLLRTLVAAPLAAHQVLYAAGQPIEYVYFPTRGSLVSLGRDLGDGKSLGPGLAGYEGMAGVEVFLGGDAAQFTATVLAQGESLRMEAGAFRAEVRADGRLTARLERYIQFLLFQISQVAGCHRFHPLEQHICSLLLRLRAHTGSDEFQITHAMFARLLGVRRVGITQVARKLQRAGLIRYRWGKITTLERQGLETSACVCHRQIEQAYQQLLGSP